MNPLALHSPDSHTVKSLQIQLATEQQRAEIYRIRHLVYAHELHQHSENTAGALHDSLDEFNQYLVASEGGKIVGFISVTPPGGPSYSIDKYLSRDQLPFSFNDPLYEVRLLTILPSKRRKEIAPLLMYAALRWVESRGGNAIMAIGRCEILSLYLKAGLRPTGIIVQSGAVSFEVIYATTEELQRNLTAFGPLLDKLEQKIDWALPIPFHKPAPCFHGGTFFTAIGERFDALQRSQSVINADVLDAWFDPSPKVLTAVRDYLPWLLRTSPPNDASGLMETISRVRAVPSGAVLPGAGSSALIFLAFTRWLDRSSRVLILDPTYGEYAHVLEKVIRCQVDRLSLTRQMNYQVNLDRLSERLRSNYDLVVLVNPNSPTGQHIHKEELIAILNAAPQTTRFWIDETYVDYIGADQSLESFAAQSTNVVICKSMSKVYALSGARVAYLCAPPQLLEELRAFTPPWAVSLPAQVAAVHALQDADYYATRYAETHPLREDLIRSLTPLGFDIIPTRTNFFLTNLPVKGPDAAQLVERCRAHGLFLRNASAMGTTLGDRAVRIAVKDARTNQAMVNIISQQIRSA